MAKPKVTLGLGYPRLNRKVLSNGAVVDANDYGEESFSPEEEAALGELSRRVAAPQVRLGFGEPQDIKRVPRKLSVRLGTPEIVPPPAPTVQSPEQERDLDQLQIQSARPGSIPGRLGAALLGATPGGGFDWANAAKPSVAPFDWTKANVDERGVPHLLVKTGRPGEMPDASVEIPREELLKDPGVLRSAVVGAAQGGTKGWADELGGLVGDYSGLADKVFRGHDPERTRRDVRAAYEQLAPEQKAKWEAMFGEPPSADSLPSRGDLVKQGMRDEFDAAMQHHPVETTAAQTAMDVASDYATGKMLKMDPTSTAFQAQMGAVSGLGGAEGSTPRQLLEAGAGAGAGALGARLGRLVSSNPIARKAEQGIAKAELDAAEMAAREVEKSIASKTGAEGSAAQKGSRALENMAREAGNTSSPTLALQAATALADPESEALRQGVLANNIKNRGRLLTELASKEAETEAAKKTAAADAQRLMEEELAHPIKRHIWPRVRKQLIMRGLVPAIGTGTGALLGGVPGAVIGGLSGVVAHGLIGGNASSAFERMMAKPGVRGLLWPAVKGIAGNLPGATVRDLTREGGPMLVDDLLGDDPDTAKRKALAQALAAGR